MHFCLFLRGLLMRLLRLLRCVRRVCRVCRVCVSRVLQFCANFSFFSLRKMEPKKKHFPLRGQNPGEAPRTPLTRWACGAEARAPGDQW